MATTKSKFNFRLFFRSIFFRSFLAGVLLTSVLSACSTYVTPKKVDRIIVKDSWKITKFLFGGEDIATEFSGKTLGFGDSGSITVLPFSGTTGHWETGLDKKPTILYISGFVDSTFFKLNDDWTVSECSKSKIILESESGATTNRVTLIKEET